MRRDLSTGPVNARAPPLAARLAHHLKLQDPLRRRRAQKRTRTARLVQARRSSPPPRRYASAADGSPTAPPSSAPTDTADRCNSARAAPTPAPPQSSSSALVDLDLAASQPGDFLRRNMNRPPVLANAPPREPVNLRRRARAPTKLRTPGKNMLQPSPVTAEVRFGRDRAENGAIFTTTLLPFSRKQFRRRWRPRGTVPSHPQKPLNHAVCWRRGRLSIVRRCQC